MTQGLSIEEILKSPLTQIPKSYKQSFGPSVETREEDPVLRFLLQESSEVEDRFQSLLRRINGISEPATVPHQTPEAGVIPKGGKNGKS